MKLIDFEGTVNVSLGIPIIRTSVDHGTAVRHCGAVPPRLPKGILDRLAHNTHRIAMRGIPERSASPISFTAVDRCYTTVVRKAAPKFCRETEAKIVLYFFNPPLGCSWHEPPRKRVVDLDRVKELRKERELVESPRSRHPIHDPVPIFVCPSGWTDSRHFDLGSGIRKEQPERPTLA